MTDESLEKLLKELKDHGVSRTRIAKLMLKMCSDGAITLDQAAFYAETIGFHASFYLDSDIEEDDEMVEEDDSDDISVEYLFPTDNECKCEYDVGGAKISFSAAIADDKKNDE